MSKLETALNVVIDAAVLEGRAPTRGELEAMFLSMVDVPDGDQVLRYVRTAADGQAVFRIDCLH